MSDELPTSGLFTEQTGRDVAATFAILVGSMIAAGGGLGGGGVFVPIYILILQYPPKFAAALSQSTIFGGSIVNLMMNLSKFHPERPHRPLTDFSTLLIFEPMLLVGTIFGVLLNVMSPDILILVLLAVVLSYATVRTTNKALRLWRAETAAQRKLERGSKSEGEAKGRRNSVPSTSHSTGVIDVEHHGDDEMVGIEDIADYEQLESGRVGLAAPTEIKVDIVEVTKDELPAFPDSADVDRIHRLSRGCGVDSKEMTGDKLALCEQILAKEAEVKRPAAVLLVVWLFVSAFSILKKEEVTGVAECSALLWVIAFLPVPAMVAVSYYMTRREYDCYRIKISSGCWAPAAGDIALDGSFVRILKYPATATVAGILGGLLGIGGGMIVSPLLIALGVLPTVAAATSAMAVLITSSSAMLQFLLIGYLRWDYTLFFMAIGVTGTFVGQTAVNHAVRRYGRTSVVVFAVVVLMALAIVLMAVNGIVSLVDGVSWAFSAPC